MLGGGQKKNKAYASCSEVLKNLATYNFWVRRFNDKNTLFVFIQDSKTTNKLQRKYLEGKKLEVTYDSQVPSLKCNKQCNRDAFRE